MSYIRHIQSIKRGKKKLVNKDSGDNHSQMEGENFILNKDEKNASIGTIMANRSYTLKTTLNKPRMIYYCSYLEGSCALLSPNSAFKDNVSSFPFEAFTSFHKISEFC